MESVVPISLIIMLIQCSYCCCLIFGIIAGYKIASHGAMSCTVADHRITSFGVANYTRISYGATDGRTIDCKIFFNVIFIF